jgi:virulence-associated protein VapD
MASVVYITLPIFAILGHKGEIFMYAITFDLDTETLRETYHNDSYTNAYSDIRKVMIANGFEWQQGSVYFGGDDVDAVTCVMVAQELTRTFEWFEPSVRDIRMLRIEEKNDLSPAIARTPRKTNRG